MSQRKDVSDFGDGSVKLLKYIEDASLYSHWII